MEKVEEITNAVIALCLQKSYDATLEITEDTHLFNDMGFDSLDFTDLIFCIEREFKISISTEEMDSIKTVSDIIGIVVEKCS